MRPVRFIVCFCIFGNLAFGEGSPFESRLPRTNLLVYHGAGGQIATVKTKSDWQKRRLEILKGMQQIMGPLPGKEKRSALDVKIGENVDCGSYVRQSLTYVSEPGSRTPAYLLIPKVALHEPRTAAVSETSRRIVLFLDQIHCPHSPNVACLHEPNSYGHQFPYSAAHSAAC